MHDWTIIANPWPGIRIVECAECGSKARRIGRPDTASVVDMNGRAVASCQRMGHLALAVVAA
jgi:hypothetical protein